MKAPNGKSAQCLQNSCDIDWHPSPSKHPPPPPHTALPPPPPPPPPTHTQRLTVYSCYSLFVSNVHSGLQSIIQNHTYNLIWVSLIIQNVTDVRQIVSLIYTCTLKPNLCKTNASMLKSNTCKYYVNQINHESTADCRYIERRTMGWAYIFT